MKALENLIRHLESEEGKKSLQDYLEREKRKELIQKSQLLKLHNRNLTKDQFRYLVTKIENKYSSDEYYNRWIKRGIMPPETLLSFLYSYAETYGKECSSKEVDKYGCAFTNGMYKIHDVIFVMNVGQGTIIKTILL